METRGRTQDGKGDRSGDGNDSSSGDGNREVGGNGEVKGAGEAKKWKKSHKNFRRDQALLFCTRYHLGNSPLCRV